jgi:energy-coupling factor transport system ATP-binding protein
VVVMEAGRISFDGSPRHAARHLATAAPWLLPPVTQAFAAAGRPELPLSVREARALVTPTQPREQVAARCSVPEPVVAVEAVHKRFGEIESLRGASTGFPAGRVTALLGPNGAGKTTLAQIAAGLVKPDSGHRRGEGLSGYVSQNPAHHALRETVAGEVAYALGNLGVAPAGRAVRAREELERFGLDELADRHPRDLSSGERQRLAIASVTVMRPKLLLLDEPTRGLDGLRKLALAELVRRLAGEGCAVGVVTHDVDFAGEAAMHVTTMARGRVLADRAPRELLARGGLFACQLGLALGCVSVSDAVAQLAIPREHSHV